MADIILKWSSLKVKNFPTVPNILNYDTNNRQEVINLGVFLSNDVLHSDTSFNSICRLVNNLELIQRILAYISNLVDKDAVISSDLK